MSDREKWLEHKRQLTAKGLVHPIFTECHSVTFVATNPQGFEPLLIARHAQRVSELLDRCLAIRKDIRELEVLEMKAATDYDLFNSTSKLDEQMDILRLQIESKTSDQTGFDRAAVAFGVASALERGLTEIAKGRDAALDDELKNFNTIKDLIAARWKSLRGYQDAYHARYQDPGNAHNYGERATLLLEVMDVLMQEALERGTALATGIKRIYGRPPSTPPTSVNLQSIDQFAVWALKVLKSLSYAAEQETVSEMIIPVVQPWLPSQQPLMTEADFDNAVLKTAAGRPISLSFVLPSDGLLDPRTRLKGLGLSFGNKTEIVPGSGIDRNQTVDAFTRLTVKITTPAQAADDGTDYLRPQVVAGNVGLHGTGTQ